MKTTLGFIALLLFTLTARCQEPLGEYKWRDLAQSGMKSMVVWALSDNEPATEFYRALGGRMVARSSEKFGPKSLDKVAFAWSN